MTAGGVITAEMVAPLSAAISGNIPILLPVGIGIMAIMLGVSLIPRIVYKFF